jgi:hypothetical protein
MYAFKTRSRIRKPVDFKVRNEEQFYSWRKHPDLHGWMEKLYRARGGFDEDFDLVNLRLLPQDIDHLEAAVRSATLPKTTGFFFGESRPEYAEGDLVFIERARQAIAHGYSVYYSSWW